MNPPKCSAKDYLQFLIAAQSRFTCTEAARCQPDAPDSPARPESSTDAFNCLLLRLPAKTRALWRDARKLVDPTDGILIIADSRSGQALRSSHGVGRLALERQTSPRGHRH
jgi:hypothetical protein